MGCGFLWGRGLFLLKSSHQSFMLTGVHSHLAPDPPTRPLHCPHRSFVLTGVCIWIPLDRLTVMPQCSHRLDVLTGMCG